jgi:hypothetical protein
MLASSAYADQYEQALSTTKDALFVQYGVNQKLEQAGKYFVHKLNMDQPVAYSLYTYRVIKTKSISFSVAKETRIGVTLNSLTFSMRFK